MEIREKVFPRKHRDKCRQKRFRSMCSVKKAERKIYAPICSEIRSNAPICSQIRSNEEFAFDV